MSVPIQSRTTIRSQRWCTVRPRGEHSILIQSPFFKSSRPTRHPVTLNGTERLLSLIYPPQRAARAHRRSRSYETRRMGRKTGTLMESMKINQWKAGKFPLTEANDWKFEQCVGCCGSEISCRRRTPGDRNVFPALDKACSFTTDKCWLDRGKKNGIWDWSGSLETENAPDFDSGCVKIGRPALENDDSGWMFPVAEKILSITMKWRINRI